MSKVFYPIVSNAPLDRISKTKQADQARKTRPWLKSTGPRTAQGKAAIRHYALRHGGRRQAYRELSAALTAQRRFMAFAFAAIAERDRLAFSSPAPNPLTAQQTGENFFRENDEQTGQFGPIFNPVPLWKRLDSPSLSLYKPPFPRGNFGGLACTACLPRPH